MARTARDQGYDLVMGNWAAVVGPRGLAPAQVAYYELERAMLAELGMVTNP